MEDLRQRFQRQYISTPVRQPVLPQFNQHMTREDVAHQLGLRYNGKLDLHKYLTLTKVSRDHFLILSSAWYYPLCRSAHSGSYRRG